MSAHGLNYTDFLKDLHAAVANRYGADTEHDLSLQEVYRFAIAHTIIEDPEDGGRPAAPATMAAVTSSVVPVGSAPTSAAAAQPTPLAAALASAGAGSAATDTGRSTQSRRADTAGHAVA